MSLLKILSIGLAVAALGCGLRSAYLWRASSLVSTDPIWPSWPPGQSFEPPDPHLMQAGVNAGLAKGLAEAAPLNKEAAIWTGASVILSGLSSVIGALT